MGVKMFTWKKIYSTYSLQEQIGIKKKLEENGISVKIKVRSSRNRLSDQVILGANPMSTNSAGLSAGALNEYEIFVSKEHFEEARGLL